MEIFEVLKNPSIKIFIDCQQRQKYCKVNNFEMYISNVVTVNNYITQNLRKDLAIHKDSPAVSTLDPQKMPIQLHLYTFQFTYFSTRLGRVRVPAQHTIVFSSCQ